MAPAKDHENFELASRLTAAADGIVNHAAGSLERDLRRAAELIGGLGAPAQPVIPQLMSELARIADTTKDADTRLRLRRILGET